jgi:plastocyanin
MLLGKFGIFGTVIMLVMVTISVAHSAAHEGVNVEAQITVDHVHERSGREGNEDVVVWLTPLSPDFHPPPAHARRYQIVQKDKQFHPHVLAVPVGAPVEFPNEDPWFHNVFSMYKGEKFDLGLYEAGTSRTVRFDRPGVSFIFCNIHPEMSAYILVLETPFFAVSNDRGQIKIADVPPGRYRLEVWFERAESADMKKLSREITIGSSANGSEVSLGKIEIRESALAIPPHTDKHGQQYETDHPPY